MQIKSVLLFLKSKSKSKSVFELNTTQKTSVYIYLNKLLISLLERNREEKQLIFNRNSKFIINIIPYR